MITSKDGTKLLGMNWQYEKSFGGYTIRLHCYDSKHNLIWTSCALWDQKEEMQFTYFVVFVNSELMVLIQRRGEWFVRIFDFVQEDEIAEHRIVLSSGTAAHEIRKICFDEFNQTLLVTTSIGVYFVDLPDWNITQFLPTSDINSVQTMTDGSLLAIVSPQKAGADTFPPNLCEKLLVL
jgi:hypothetical protein